MAVAFPQAVGRFLQLAGIAHFLQQPQDGGAVQKRLVIVAGVDKYIGSAAAGLHVQQLAPQNILPHLQGAQRRGAAVQRIPDDAAGQAQVTRIQQDVPAAVHIVGIGMDVDAEAPGQTLPQTGMQGVDALEDEQRVIVVFHGAGLSGTAAGRKIENGEFGAAGLHQSIDRAVEAIQVQPVDGFEVFAAILPQRHILAVAVKIIQRDAHGPPAHRGKIRDQQVGGGGLAGGGGTAEQHDMAAAGDHLLGHGAQLVAETRFDTVNGDLGVFKGLPGDLLDLAGVTQVGFFHGAGELLSGRVPGETQGAGLRPDGRLNSIILHRPQKYSSFCIICGRGAAGRTGKAAEKQPDPPERRWRRWGWRAETRRLRRSRSRPPKAAPPRR